MVNLYTDLVSTLPLGFMVGLSLVVLLSEAILKDSEKISYWLSVVGLIIGGWLSFERISMPGLAFNGMITTGGYGVFFATLFIIAALLTIILSREYIDKQY